MFPGEEDRQAGHRPKGQRELRDRNVRNLKWDLLQLQRQAGNVGSHATRRDRSYALAQMADTLHKLGYGGLRAEGLKPKHVGALVRHWRDCGLSHATMMNRMAQVRWWAERVGRISSGSTRSPDRQCTRTRPRATRRCPSSTTRA